MSVRLAASVLLLVLATYSPAGASESQPPPDRVTCVLPVAPVTRDMGYSLRRCFADPAPEASRLAGLAARDAAAEACEQALNESGAKARCAAFGLTFRATNGVTVVAARPDELETKLAESDAGRCTVTMTLSVTTVYSPTKDCLMFWPSRTATAVARARCGYTCE